MSSSCNQADLDKGIVCLTLGQGIGLSMDMEAGLISVIALVGVFILIFVSRSSVVTSANCIVMQVKAYRRGKLVRGPMDVFLVSLQIIREHLWILIPTVTACAVLIRYYYGAGKSNKYQVDSRW
jgi:hypothetical protein